MKTKLIISLMFLVAVSVYIFMGSFTNETKPETITKPVTPMFTGGGGDNFIIGAFQSGWDVFFEYLPDTVGFNLWQIYNGGDTDAAGRHYPDGWTHPNFAPGDSLFADRNAYVSQVDSVLERVRNHNMKALMMRPKIEWLCFGQRSDYQCEDTSKVNPDLWFYSFNNHDVAGQYGSDYKDNTIYGDSQWVRYCQLEPANAPQGAGFVVRRLKANAEQCKSVGDFHGDGETDWHIKPRIRIDSNFAHNNQNAPVCSLKVLKQDGSTLKEVVIKAKHFIDNQGNYNGRYLEEFNFGLDPDLVIHGAWGSGWNHFTARGNQTSEQGYNLADIQVYWFGNCDMWLDYVRVDNDVADELFKGIRDPWLLWEARDIACYNSGAASYRFYVGDLFEFNNIPCMAYVSRKLDSISYANCQKHVTLTSNPIPTFYSAHVPWDNRLSVWNAGHIKRNYVEKVGVQEIFIASYPFNSTYYYPEVYNPPYCTWSKIPNTLPTHSVTGTLAQAVAPNVYDQWLQMSFDSIPYSFETGFSGGNRSTVQEDQGNFRYMLQLGDAMSKETELPFIYHTYAGIWYCKCGAEYTDCDNNGITGEVQREPTNEELDMTANVAVSYGARGIIYWQFLSANNTTPGDTFYSRGIMRPWTQDSGLQPRRTNIYGQPKWDKIISLVNRMKTWEPYVMSFDNDNRHSYIYRTERKALINESYFTEIYSLKISNYPPACEEDFPEDIPTYWVAECKSDKYLQVATFKKSTDDANKYFMIVNRRCSPFRNDLSEDNNGGRRWVKVRFDTNHPEMSSSDKWQIIDLETNTTIVPEFNKTLFPLIDLEIFMPGQGKLYKLVPVS